MKRYASLLQIICTVILPLLLECSFNPDGVAGSETTNGINVAVVDNAVTGSTDAGIVVLLYSSSYLPHVDEGYVNEFSVDKTGSFLFAELDTGIYTIIALDITQNRGALLSDLPVYVGTAGYADSAKFEGLHDISGDVTCNSTFQPSCIVYMPGTPYYDSTDVYGQFTFNAVPRGTYRIIARYQQDIYKVPALVDTASIVLPSRDSDTWVSLTLEPEGQ